MSSLLQLPLLFYCFHWCQSALSSLTFFVLRLFWRGSPFFGLESSAPLAGICAPPLVSLLVALLASSAGRHFFGRFFVNWRFLLRGCFLGPWLLRSLAVVVSSSLSALPCFRVRVSLSVRLLLSAYHYVWGESHVLCSLFLGHAAFPSSILFLAPSLWTFSC